MTHDTSSPHGLIAPLTMSLKAFNTIPMSLISLMGRVAIAMIFWQSGQTKVNGFQVTDQAIFLFEHEYAVPLISPALAAHMAAGAEHLFPVLLVLGLATRASALGLLMMTLVIQLFVYPDAWITHLTWGTILMFLMARGAGVLSLDYLIAKRS